MRNSIAMAKGKIKRESLKNNMECDEKGRYNN